MKKVLSIVCLSTFLTIGIGSTTTHAKDMDELKSTPEQVLQEFNNRSSSEELIARTGKRVEFKRGGALAWSKDIISWNYSGGSISSSSGDQDSGYIFPNIVKKGGITRTSASSSTHSYRGKKTIGAGVVTPWRDVTVYETDYTDYYRVTGSGNSYWD